ncbi:catalase-domain-containing protein [Aspergillus ellipticus CBS 707.79]|uniref:Catalase n=1 Tax=Aspergillus ellipticus CBS 707.79 TaxID=1448320 RepID=A0A319CXE6_9EURO|nr:catalase-domain-containing protein [Aspergillus ellipticus CBS 707.79]
MRHLWLLPAIAGLAGAQCPFLSGEMSFTEEADNPTDTIKVVEQPMDNTLYTNDTDSYMTTDWGTAISDQESLKAGTRGPTLLEDFIFRQKLLRFDHERIPERVVHARGAGAHGKFTSYGDWSNVTAADFLSSVGKETPTFCRFSTVVGFRGSVDTARDVHGHACRFYTDEGNYDIVGINMAPFFIQDAIQFPDLVHAIKPMPNNEIPQAATAHTSAWDFFSQQSTALHTALWLMSGHGIPRSYRHMNGYGVHSFRFVAANGTSKVVRYRWKSLQGVASLVWDEAQAAAGKNSDFHRQDLYNAIENGRYPKYELQAQIMDESDMLRFGFDLLDPTKLVPEEVVPYTPLGVMELNANPTNYFAEVEQVGFQPGHIVRGIDFTDDPLLQGRIFSYLDTQINRHGGPNFEQMPINRPRNGVHNHNRDGFGQQQIPTNNWAYSPNSMNTSPKQANQTTGNGFFTAPNRDVSGHLGRQSSPTFANHWSQPAMFWNSLVPAEQQFLVSAIVFENSKVASPHVRRSVVAQLNKVNNNLAVRVAKGLGLDEPSPDPTYYTTNKTANVGTFGKPLLNIEGLQVGFLASTSNPESIAQGQALAATFAAHGVDLNVVAETYADGVNTTYVLSDAINFDAVIVADAVQRLFAAPSWGGNATEPSHASAFYPPGRPLQILVDSFKYGKPVGAVGSGRGVLRGVGIGWEREGVYVAGANETESVAQGVVKGLFTWRFLDRFMLDQE